MIHPLGRALRHHRRLRTGIVQLIYVVAAVALGLVVPQIPVGFTVSSSRVIDALITVAVGIVTFMGIVYSLLFLVVQFGSTAFTPRINLFRDAPIVWHAFGFYTGVLVFSFTAAFAIGNSDRASALVPITLVLSLVVAVTLFRALQTQAFQSLQLASVLAQITKRGREVIDGIYPLGTGEPNSNAGGNGAVGVASGGQGSGGHEVVWPGESLVLQVVDVPRLVRTAEEAGAMIELSAVPGATIPEGGVVAVAHGVLDSRLDVEILKALKLGAERTFEQDPRFALRLLSDIALRALSPATNDPATAVQSIDSMDSLLRALAVRDLDIGDVPDAQGATRVLLPLPRWEEYVGLALDEVIGAGLASIQVRARLDRLLQELMAIAPPQRRDALQRRLHAVRRENCSSPVLRSTEAR